LTVKKFHTRDIQNLDSQAIDVKWWTPWTSVTFADVLVRGICLARRLHWSH